MTIDKADRPDSPEGVVFEGRYARWEDARRASIGYDDPVILEKVLAATLRVLSGDAACERDSVPLSRIEYSLPLLVCLLYVASRSGNRLSILDFGGSLGSSYWQNRHFLRHLSELRWSVVEQAHFAHAGQTRIAAEHLRFFESVETCAGAERPNAALLSSVLPYLENPLGTFGSLLALDLPFVIVDRTPFFVDDLPDRLTVERVPSAICRSSYPAWFFNLANFQTFIENAGYRLVEIFDSWEQWVIEGDEAQNKCLLLERASDGRLGR